VRDVYCLAHKSKGLFGGEGKGRNTGEERGSCEGISRPRKMSHHNPLALRRGCNPFIAVWLPSEPQSWDNLGASAPRPRSDSAPASPASSGTPSVPCPTRPLAAEALPPQGAQTPIQEQKSSTHQDPFHLRVHCFFNISLPSVLQPSCTVVMIHPHWR